MPKAPPKPETRMIRCPSCCREQPDPGKREVGRGATCPYCGCSPLPSYSYPRSCAFYPKPLPKSLTEMVSERRAASRR